MTATRTTSMTIIRQPEPLLLRRRDRLRAHLGRYERHRRTLRTAILVTGAILISAAAAGLSVIAYRSDDGVSLVNDETLGLLWSATPVSALVVLTLLISFALATSDQSRRRGPHKRYWESVSSIALSGTLLYGVVGLGMLAMLPTMPLWWPLPFALGITLYWIVLGAIVWLALVAVAEARRRLTD